MAIPVLLLATITLDSRELKGVGSDFQKTWTWTCWLLTRMFLLQSFLQLFLSVLWQQWIPLKFRQLRNQPFTPLISHKVFMPAFCVARERTQTVEAARQEYWVSQVVAEVLFGVVATWIKVTNGVNGCDALAKWISEREGGWRERGRESLWQRGRRGR